MEMKVEKGLLQAVVNYLETKPYNEVSGFIERLIRSTPVKEPVEE
jgi:hypothetical protein